MVLITNEAVRNKPSIQTYPRCDFVNAIENKYCSKYVYPPKSSTFFEIKTEEEKRIKERIREKKK